MININYKEQCCGCMACYNACPRNCISFLADEEGFLYPHVDTNMCVNCGMCDAVCPFLAGKKGTEEKETYGCYALDDEIRMNSSSGGIFSLFALWILQEGGVVFGTAMSEDCKLARVICVDCVEELHKLRGSKYVQSEVGTTFKKVKHELEKQRKVLFSGTPCQIDGLRLFLRKDYHNLYCIDIICHGVPSPALWGKYIDYDEYKKHTKIKKVDFRCKDLGWSDFGLKKEYAKGYSFATKDADPYMQMFLHDFCLRMSCYQCKAKDIKLSDITLGDFWKVKDVISKLSDDKGITLAIIRTDRGKELFDLVRDKMKIYPCEYESAITGNKVEYLSVEKPTEREMFYRDMAVMTFDQLAKKYVEKSFGMKVKQIIKKCLSLVTRI